MRFILLVWHSFSLFLTLSLFHFSSFSVLFCFFCCRLPPTHSLSSSPSPLSLLPTSSCRHLLPFSSVFFFILFLYSYRDIDTVLSIRCTWHQVLSGLTRVELPVLLSLASPHQSLPIIETNNKKPFCRF